MLSFNRGRGSLRSPRVSADGLRVYWSTYSNGSILVEEQLPEWNQSRAVSGSKYAVSLAVDPQGEYACVGAIHGAVTVCDLSTMTTKGVSISGDVYAASTSSNGDYAFFANYGSSNGIFRVSMRDPNLPIQRGSVFWTYSYPRCLAMPFCILSTTEHVYTFLSLGSQAGSGIAQNDIETLQLVNHTTIPNTEKCRLNSVILSPEWEGEGGQRTAYCLKSEYDNPPFFSIIELQELTCILDKQLIGIPSICCGRLVFHEDSNSVLVVFQRSQNLQIQVLRLGQEQIEEGEVEEMEEFEGVTVFEREGLWNDHMEGAFVAQGILYVAFSKGDVLGCPLESFM